MKTMFVAAFRPHLLAVSAGTALSRREARAFAMIMMVPVAAGVVALLFAACYQWLGKLPLSPPKGYASWAGSLSYPIYLAATRAGAIPALGFWLAFVLTVMPARIARFWRGDQQQREGIITVSYYLVGALALGGTAGGLLGALAAAPVAAALDRASLVAAATMTTTSAGAGALLLWLVAGYRFDRQIRTLYGEDGPRFWLYWPVFLLMAGLLGVMLPWVVGLLYLVVDSLR